MVNEGDESDQVAEHTPQNQESREESVANVSPQERLRRIEQLESKLSKYINPENQKKGKRK